MPFRDIAATPRLTLPTKPAFEIVAGEAWSVCTAEVTAVSAGERRVLSSAIRAGVVVALSAVNGYLCPRNILGCITKIMPEDSADSVVPAVSVAYEFVTRSRNAQSGAVVIQKRVDLRGKFVGAVKTNTVYTFGENL
jgi:hypothetical protein